MRSYFSIDLLICFSSMRESASIPQITSSQLWMKNRGCHTTVFTSLCVLHNILKGHRWREVCVEGLKGSCVLTRRTEDIDTFIWTHSRGDERTSDFNSRESESSNSSPEEQGIMGSSRPAVRTESRHLNFIWMATIPHAELKMSLTAI